MLEVVIVLAITALILTIALPSMNSLQTAGSLTASAAALQAILLQARTQAVARNSYVFVGLYESDVSKSDSLRPAPSGTGRVWVGAAVTKDSTQSYSFTNSVGLSSGWSVADLAPVGKLQHFNNIHLSTNASFYLTNTPANTVSPVGDTSATNTPFGWPLENSNSVTQFSTGVIQFNPQGTAILPGSSTPTEYIQIALIPTHGNQVMSNNPNAAVVQVDALTGLIQTYRP